MRKLFRRRSEHSVQAYNVSRAQTRSLMTAVQNIKVEEASSFLTELPSSFIDELAARSLDAGVTADVFQLERHDQCLGSHKRMGTALACADD